MITLTCNRLCCKRPAWPTGDACVREVSLKFEASLIYGLLGEDRHGKELLLRLLGLLEQPDSGTVSVFGETLSRPNHPTFAHQRNSLFGYLFSQPYLLPSFSVAENIAMPLLRIRGVSAKEASDRTRSLLQIAGLLELGDFPACQLDIAMQQQVALIRALVHFPKILIVASPFPATVHPLIRLAAYNLGTTIICTGEENSLATLCDRLFIMHEGVVRKSRSILETVV